MLGDAVLPSLHSLLLCKEFMSVINRANIKELDFDCQRVKFFVANVEQVVRPSREFLVV